MHAEPWTVLPQVEHANEASSERDQRKLLGGSKEVVCDDKLYEQSCTLPQVEHANEASSERNQRNLLGGYKEVSGDDKDAAAAASFAAQQLSEQSNSLQPFAVQEARFGAGVEGALVHEELLQHGSFSMAPSAQTPHSAATAF